MKRNMIIFAALLVIGFIFFQSTVPENASDRESIWFTGTVINPVLRKLGYNAVDTGFVRKGAHIFEFFLLSFAAVFICKGRFVQSIYTGFTAAFLDESIQVVTGRGALITDIWVDLIGVFFGTVFGLIIYRVYCSVRDGYRKRHIAKRQGKSSP